MPRTRKCYLGIDPGKRGGLGLLKPDGTALLATRMPEDKVRILDVISRLKQEYAGLIMIVEQSQPMPKQGIVSSFNYGRHFATFEDAALLLKIPYHTITPAVWKRAMQLTKDKNDSFAACRKLFPTVNLIPQGCRKQHDGIAEALLIAEYGRRKQL
jgi:crossover junction endodeoxyribonuclease RuvC